MQALGLRGVKLGQGARNDKQTSATVALVANELGVLRRTAFYRLKAARDYLALPAEMRKQVDELRQPLPK